MSGPAASSLAPAQDPTDIPTLRATLTATDPDARLRRCTWTPSSSASTPSTP